MWCEERTDKDGKTYYLFIEKYKDSLTDKWKRTSVAMNKNTRPSQKEAQRRLEAKIKAIQNDTTSKDLKTLTFHQACDEWFEHYKRISGAKQTTISEKKSIINAIKTIVDKNALIRNMKYHEVNKMFDKWHNLNRSQSAMYSYKSVIKRIFGYIKITYNLTDISFLDDIKIPVKAKTYDDVQKQRENYLEDKELKTLLKVLNTYKHVEKHPSKKRNNLIIPLIVEFQALNGLRIAELLAIQKNNIDFDNKKLDINGSIVWVSSEDNKFYGVKDTTKNAYSNRVISLSNRSIEILKYVLLENKKSKQWESEYYDRGFVFTNNLGNPIQTRKVNEKIKNAIELINSSDDYKKDEKINKKVTTHTLRHTHISTLAQIGVPLKAIMNRVGHNDPKTTLQIYSHVTQQMENSMMNKLESIGY